MTTARAAGRSHVSAVGAGSAQAMAAAYYLDCLFGRCGPISNVDGAAGGSPHCQIGSLCGPAICGRLTVGIGVACDSFATSSAARAWEADDILARPACDGAPTPRCCPPGPASGRRASSE